MADDPLALDRETMRRMGYEVVDLLVERMASLPDGPVLTTARRAEMATRIDEPAPSAGRDFADLLARLDRDVLPFVGHFDHPRFFGYIPGAGTWPAALGDPIAAIEWGRDFSYGRTATVVALEPTELLAFPAAALRELMTDCPPVDRAVRRIAQARLGTR